MKALVLSKGVSGPSGLDADGCCKILASPAFGTATVHLPKTFCQLIKTNHSWIYFFHLQTNSLE